MNTKAIQSVSLLILFVTALVVSQAAFGQGFYAGAELGRSSYDDNINVDAETVKLDGDSTSFRLAVGYDLNRYFSAEAGYVDFGKLEFDDVDVGGITGSVDARADGSELSISGRIPVGGRFSLKGRTGLMWWNAKTQALGVSNSSSKRDVFFGLSGEFAATRKLGITAGWTRYNLDSEDVDYLSVGFRFRFGVAD